MLPNTSTKLTGAQAAAAARAQPGNRKIAAVAAAPPVPPAPPKQDRTANLHRAQIALNSVMQQDVSSRREYVMEAHAAELLIDYSTELSEAILEDAAEVAKHRGALEIEPCDINIVLVKKYHINLPHVVADVPRLVLHKERLGTGANSMRNGGSSAQTVAAVHSSGAATAITRYMEDKVLSAPILAPRPEPRGPPAGASKPPSSKAAAAAAAAGASVVVANASAGAVANETAVSDAADTNDASTSASDGAAAGAGVGAGGATTARGGRGKRKAEESDLSPKRGRR